jgi:PKD repeat protein
MAAALLTVSAIGVVPARPVSAATAPSFTYAAEPRRCDWWEAYGMVRPDGSYPRATWPHPYDIGAWLTYGPCLMGQAGWHPEQASEWNLNLSRRIVREGETFTVTGDIHWTDFPHQGGASHDWVLGTGPGRTFWKATSATAWALNPDCCIYDAPPVRLLTMQDAPEPIAGPVFSRVAGCGEYDTSCTWRLDRAPVWPSGTTRLPWYAIGAATGRPVYPWAKGFHPNMWETAIMFVPDPTPVADFSYERVEGKPRTVAFREQAGDRNGYLVSGVWSFGDGTTSTEPNPTHAFTKPGDSFPVRLTVTDDEGFTKSVTKTVVVANDPIADFTWFADTNIDPLTLSLDGSKSRTDPGVTLTQFRWEIAGLDCTGTCWRTVVSGRKPAVELPALGQYQVQLVVTDSRGRLSAPVRKGLSISEPSIRVTASVTPDYVAAPEPTAEQPNPEPVPVSVTVKIENIGTARVEHIRPPARLAIFTRDGVPGTTDRRIVHRGNSHACACDMTLDPGWFTNVTYRLGVVDDGWWRITPMVTYADPHTGRTSIASDNATLDATGTPLRLHAELQPGVDVVDAGRTFYVVGELENTSTNQVITLPARWLEVERQGALAASRRPGYLAPEETLGDMVEQCAACRKPVPRVIQPGRRLRFAIGYTTVDESPFRSRVDLSYAVTATATDPNGVPSEVDVGPVSVRVPLRYVAPNLDVVRFSTRFADAAMIEIGNQLIEGTEFFAQGKFKALPHAAVLAMGETWNNMTLAERMQFLQMPAQYIGMQVTQSLYDAANRTIGELMTLHATGQYDALADRLGQVAGATGTQLTADLVIEALTAGFGYLFAAGGRAVVAGTRRLVPEAAEALDRFVRRVPTAPLGVELDLKAVPAGRSLSFAQGQKFWGVTEAKLRSLVDYCKANRIMVMLRDRTAEAMEWIARGALPKMEDLKLKAVNWIDADYLGYSADDVGTLVFRRPRDPRQSTKWAQATPAEQSDILARHQQRLAEYDELHADYLGSDGLAQRGVTYRENGTARHGQYAIDANGRVTVNDRRVAGDVDVLHILREDGTEFLASEYAELMTHFRWLEEHLDLQHMSTGNWWATTPRHMGIRDTTFATHNAQTGKAVLNVSGAGLRTARVDMRHSVFLQGLPLRVTYIGNAVTVVGESIR